MVNRPAIVAVLVAVSWGGAGCLDPSTFADGGIDVMVPGGRGGALAGAGGGQAGAGGGQAGAGAAGRAGSAGAGNGGRAGNGAAGAGGVAGRGAGVGGAAGTAGGGAGRGGAPGGAGGHACAAEQCNGRDDDCDGVIDNGCPIAGQPLGTRTTSTTSPVFGSLTHVNNTTFAAACPDGQAIIGFTGNAGSGLDAVGVQCGTLQVREDRTAEPFKYSVAVGPGLDFPPAGGGGGTQHLIDSQLICGPDEVVVSVTMTTEPTGGSCPNNGCKTGETGNAYGCAVVYGMAVSCARYNIAGTPGAFKLAVAATPVTSARVGGPGRAMPVADTPVFSCLPTGVLRQLSGAYGPWIGACGLSAVVDGLQFGCTNPTLPLH